MGEGKTCEEARKQWKGKGSWPVLSCLHLYSLCIITWYSCHFLMPLALVDLETGHDLDHCFYSSGECSF